MEKIKELYDLAEESLNQQVERYESESAIASRDGAPAAHPEATPPRARKGSGRSNGNGVRPASQQHGNSHVRGEDRGEFTPASNKQVSFMTNLAKRQGLTTPQLRKRVAEIVGRDVDLYDLTKDEAGIVLDVLTSESPAPATRRR